ncbi:MAG: DUF423 domain-containing protein [Myxococcales bacterium]|nr:DUF423 domain-containing protein [Myxococcales bacterium]
MWWRVAGVSGALAVMLGAFGAHGLKSWVDDPHLLEIWDKAARYHLVHAVALLGVAMHPRRPAVAGGGFVLGTLLFSGSLYAMTLTGATWLGAITPLGGLSFIAGWIGLAAASPEVSGRDH